MFALPSHCSPPSPPHRKQALLHTKVDNCFTGRLCSKIRSSGVNFGWYCFPLGTRMSTCHFLLPRPCLLPLIAFTSALETLPVLFLLPLPFFVERVLKFAFVLSSFRSSLRRAAPRFPFFLRRLMRTSKENHRRCLVDINLPARLNVSPFYVLPRPSLAPLAHFPLFSAPFYRPFSLSHTSPRPSVPILLSLQPTFFPIFPIFLQPPAFLTLL